MSGTMPSWWSASVGWVEGKPLIKSCHLIGTPFLSPAAWNQQSKAVAPASPLARLPWDPCLKARGPVLSGQNGALRPCQGGSGGKRDQLFLSGPSFFAVASASPPFRAQQMALPTW